MSYLELYCVAKREDGCFSVLKWCDPESGSDGRPFAVSVDRTFEDLRTVLQNAVYRCKRDFYHHGGYETFEIIVPGHDRVMFHKGNKEVDSLACVCIAESFTQMDGVTAVADSKHGFDEFMEVTNGLEEFDMQVLGR